MEYSLTIFKSIYDNETHRNMCFKSWDQFVKLLFKLSKIQGYKPKKGIKSSLAPSPLISPANYKSDTLRRNDNVLCWGGWAALDIDDYECSFEDAAAAFKPYSHVCYSSASSTVEHTKFRVILQLSSCVSDDKIQHFWYALNKEFNSLGDKQTKDLSRMYYVPAVYPNSNNFIYKVDGDVLDPIKLMERHSYVTPTKYGSFTDSLPIEIQERILQYKKEKLLNTSYKWNNYTDCKFVNKGMVADYKRICSTGWYSKLYEIMINIASNAMRYGYPITPNQIAELCKQIDNDSGGSSGQWYSNRPMELEASRAIDFASKKL